VVKYFTLHVGPRQLEPAEEGTFAPPVGCHCRIRLGFVSVRTLFPFQVAQSSCSTESLMWVTVSSYSPTRHSLAPYVCDDNSRQVTFHHIITSNHPQQFSFVHNDFIPIPMTHVFFPAGYFSIPFLSLLDLVFLLSPTFRVRLPYGSPPVGASETREGAASGLAGWRWRVG